MSSLDPLQVLKSFFGYSQFRSGQLEIITSIIEGKDTFALLPTGGGKSLCFQVPGLCLGGTTLVISPLIALMKDQVEAMQKKGISAAYINSTLSEEEINQHFTFFTGGKYQFLYIAPERLFTDRFTAAAQSVKIPLIAVDEAHCISEWGHNFRTPYTKIHLFIAKLPHRPVIAAFTATATNRVKKEIVHFLRLRSPQVFTKSFRRTNLFISVKKCKNENQKLILLIKFLNHHRHSAGIIYCQTRDGTEDVSALLQKFGFPCRFYHAGLDADQRGQIQDQFLKDEVRIISATNAFGMGVDKSNIRFVIHLGIPRTIEGYYQEIGRAGRDGEKGICLFMYSPKDEKMWTKIQAKQKSKLAKMHVKNVKMFLETQKCITNLILKYFGEKPRHRCQHCSNCKKFQLPTPPQHTARCQKLEYIQKKLAEKYHLPKERILTSTQIQLFSLRENPQIQIPGLGRGWQQKFNQYLQFDTTHHQ